VPVSHGSPIAVRTGHARDRVYQAIASTIACNSTGSPAIALGMPSCNMRAFRPFLRNSCTASE